MSENDRRTRPVRASRAWRHAAAPGGVSALLLLAAICRPAGAAQGSQRPAIDVAVRGHPTLAKRHGTPAAGQGSGKVTPHPGEGDGPPHPSRPPRVVHDGPGQPACAPYHPAGQGSRGAQSWTKPTRLVADPTRRYSMTIVAGTGVGATSSFTIALDPLHARHAVNSILFLACNGYYTGSAFDRIIPGRLLENSGHPVAAATGRRGARPAPIQPATGPGYTLPYEDAHHPYARGMVALDPQRAGGGSAGFFILLDRLPLPPRYTIFGNISAGLPALQRLSAAPATTQPDAQERTLPLRPARIITFILHVSPPRGKA